VQQKNDRLAGFIKAASDSLKRNNLALSELICRHIISEFGENTAAYTLLGIIAHKLLLDDFSRVYLETALRLDPENRVAEELLTQAGATVGRRAEPVTEKPRFLLIKAWGFGFWSDIDHVLGQLLLSEITGRIPVVLWGENSRFRDSGTENAFECYFEPVSGYGIEDLQSLALSYYPPKWTRQNLAEAEIDKWEGRYSRVAGLYLLGRDEDVVVSDFHTLIRDLIPWIPPDHEWHGRSVQELYRLLVAKHLKLQPGLASDIDTFAARHLQGRNMLAVHVRGSDKVIEMDRQALEKINRSYAGEISRYLARHGDAGIFLITDSVPALEEYRQRYGDRLVYTECKRSGDDTGVHFMAHQNREQMAREVIIDVYLAARCNHFIGNGRSNVSTSVLHLRDWQPDEYTLFGNSILEEVNFFLHNR
jgi:hypothetical protein